MKYSDVIALLSILALCASPAWAACTTPAAPTGKIIYNTTHDVFQGCAATGQWLAFSGSGQAGPQGPAGPAGPTGPSGPQGVPGVDGADGLDGSDAPADNLGDHIATTVLRSDTTNTDDLGTSSVRWKDGWFAGTVTATALVGSPQVENDTGSCNPGKDGRLRYVSGGTPPWQFCDGANWVNFKQPQCADDAAGECYLATTRSASDPDFSAANIASGVNILGVTGTLPGGGTCPNEAQVFESPGLSEIYVPAGCTHATMEAWGAGGGAGTPASTSSTFTTPGSGGGGSAVLRDSTNTPLVVGGGGGGGGGIRSGGWVTTGGGGGYGKTADNVVVSPGEKLRVYVGGGGQNLCGFPHYDNADSSGGAPERFSHGGGYDGGAGAKNAAAGGSVYGGGGAPWVQSTTTAQILGGNSVYGGGGGSTYNTANQVSQASTSTYGGAGGVGTYSASPPAAVVGGGGSGLGSVVADGADGAFGVLSSVSHPALAGGAGAVGGGLSAGAGSGAQFPHIITGVLCDMRGGDGRVRITWSD